MAAPTLDPLSTQLVLNVVFSFLLEKVKQSPLIPWLKRETPKLNRMVAVVTSGLAAFGVHLSKAHTDAGTYVITVTGLSLSAVAASGFAWLKSFIFQEIAYQKLVKDGNAQSAKA